MQLLEADLQGNEAGPGRVVGTFHAKMILRSDEWSVSIPCGSLNPLTVQEKLVFCPWQ